jgi:hypothetical protein
MLRLRRDFAGVRLVLDHVAEEKDAPSLATEEGFGGLIILAGDDELGRLDLAEVRELGSQLLNWCDHGEFRDYS